MTASRSYLRLAMGLMSIALVCVPPSEVIAETWYEAYEAAQRAVESRKWDVAEQKLKQSLRDGPRQGRQVRMYGVRFIAFVPDYYLGVVYFNQGRHAEAVAQFRKVEESNLVKEGDPERRQLTELREAAERQLAARVATASPIVTPPPNPSRAVDSRPSEAPRTAAEPLTGESETVRIFQRLLNEASLAVTAGRLDEARAAVTKARELGVDAGRVNDVATRVEVAEGLSGARSAIRNERWAEAERLIRRIGALDPGNRDVQAFARMLEKHGAVHPFDATLERTALRAFYVGAYAEAIDLLNRVIKQSPRNPRAHFYLACSKAALGLMQGANGRRDLEAARSAYLKAQSLGARFTTDRRYISPRVLGALEGTMTIAAVRPSPVP